jgi:hypothetical protein
MRDWVGVWGSRCGVEEGAYSPNRNTTVFGALRRRLVPRHRVWPRLHKALHHSKKAACNSASRLDLLQGLDVRIIDGTTLRLADTPRNQRCFPQPSTQAKGCGFPAM